MDRRLGVLLIDDDHDIRYLARMALEADGGFRIIGEGSDGFDAARIAGSTNPDVVLLDLEMPWVDGAEAVPHIRSRAPHALIILWTVEPNGVRADEALEMGAHALLDKAYFGVGRLADQVRELVASRHDRVRISLDHRTG